MIRTIVASRSSSRIYTRRIIRLSVTKRHGYKANRLDRRTTVDSSSGRMIRLKARIYTQANYKTNYRSLPKFVPDG